jgi:hypothetical protein
LLFSYAIKFQDCLSDVSKITELKPSVKSNVLKALICLSKYIGTYTEFTKAFKNHGIKWTSPDSFKSFINIFSNNHHDTLIEWYKDASGILADNERLFLKFTLMSGLRKSEAIKSFNRLIELYKVNRLSDYYNSETNTLEHFRYADNLRGTKNVFITVLSSEMLSQICNSKTVSYSNIRKRLAKHRLPLRIKELRSFNNSYLRKHGLLSEMVDILAGRVPKSVFTRHYLKLSQNELSSQVLPLQVEMLKSVEA